MFVIVGLHTHKTAYKIFKNIYDKLSQITHYLPLPVKTLKNILSL